MREKVAAGKTDSPCAACKLLRRRCPKGCPFAPYFPADQPHKFTAVHKVFGASNINKLLQEVAAKDRHDMVTSLVYEADARLRDPVYGSVGVITALQVHAEALQKQLDFAQAEMIRMRVRHAAYLACYVSPPATHSGSSSTTSSAQAAESYVAADPLPTWPCLS